MAHIYAEASDEELAVRLLAIEERIDQIDDEWPAADSKTRAKLAGETTGLNWQRDRVRAEIARRRDARA